MKEVLKQQLSIESMKNANMLARTKINEVEGYYPQAELDSFPITDENGTEVGKRYILRLNKKREWFKLKYPEGVVKTKIIASSGYTAKVQAFVYASYKDEQSMYIAEAKATCSVNPNDPYMLGKSEEELLGCAENKAAAKAESNALYKAGFGFQIETQDEDSAMADEQLFADLISSSTLPAPPTPVNHVSKRVEGEKKRKEEEIEDIKACGTNIAFTPRDSMAEATLPSGSILQEVTERVPEDTTYDKVAQNEVEMTGYGIEGLKAAPPLKKELSYEDALSFPYKHMGMNTLGEITKENPQMIVWMIEKMEDEIANLCKIIARNNPIVSAIAKRKGVVF